MPAGSTFTVQRGRGKLEKSGNLKSVFLGLEKSCNFFLLFVKSHGKVTKLWGGKRLFGISSPRLESEVRSTLQRT